MLLLFGIAVAAFFIVVAPLFSTSTEMKAEIDGRLPASLPASPGAHLDLDIDNVGDAVINPICVRLDSTPPGLAKSVTFQGLETIPFQGDLACGGELTAQESISIVINLDLSKSTSVSLGITPQRRATAIGTKLSGVILVSH